MKSRFYIFLKTFSCFVVACIFNKPFLFILEKTSVHHESKIKIKYLCLLVWPCIFVNCLYLCSRWWSWRSLSRRRSIFRLWRIYPWWRKENNEYGECVIPFYKCTFLIMGFQFPFNNFEIEVLNHLMVFSLQSHPARWAYIKVF